MTSFRNQRGFNLIEVAIVFALLGVILVVSMSFLRGTNNAYQAVYQDTDMNFNLRRSLNVMADEVRRSTPAKVVITNVSTSYDQIDFQVPITYAAGAVTWGANATANFKVRYMVSNNALIRRIIDTGGNTVGQDQTLADDIDTVYLNQKAFAVTINGDLLTISLRTITTGTQAPVRRTLTTAVSLRN